MTFPWTINTPAQNLAVLTNIADVFRDGCKDGTAMTSLLELLGNAVAICEAMRDDGSDMARLFSARDLFASMCAELTDNITTI